MNDLIIFKLQVEVELMSTEGTMGLWIGGIKSG